MSSGIFGAEATIRRPQGDHEATLTRQGEQRRDRAGIAGIVSIRADGGSAHDNAIEGAGHIWVPACAGMTVEGAGMTGEGAGMTGEGAGMAKGGAGETEGGAALHRQG
ncbi:hypothetical protein [Sphingobium lactosutens]|uniref:Uncharacterized protein n=1 Tax=Sphingobium lactosutens DS20 TaxID=1331060 RepID=T0HJA7_9SPHN|nr:hypothetical protein [Sphingobium lactosutens]EQB13112.1 hypothetical protein RLDS_17485 [Sphingobium lactosutens DS20]